MIREMMCRDASGELIPFSITFVTCNTIKNTGGEKITFDRAVFVGGPSKKSKIKNPKHAENFTRNIRHANGDQIITIHPLLVTRFNGKQIAQ